jgi:predicted permease
VSPSESLRGSGAAVSAGAAWRASPGLVLVQLALSLVLAIGGVLLARSLEALKAVDPGFRAEGVVSFRLSPTGERYADGPDRRRFFEEILTRFRTLPGVEAAGGASLLPLTRGYAWTDFLVEGHEGASGHDRVVADLHVVTPGYFEAMGVPRLAGRGLLPEDDDDPSVVLVNRAFARRFWDEREAVGHWLGRSGGERSAIVGVVDDVRHYGLDAEPRPAVYYPHAGRPTRTLYVAVRGPRDPRELLPAREDAVRAADPDLPVHDVAAMPERVRRSLAIERALAGLLALFAGVAVALAGIGLYGVLAFGVASQTREIAVRRALGAKTAALYRMVIGRTLRLLAGGLALGVAFRTAAFMGAPHFG